MKIFYSQRQAAYVRNLFLLGLILQIITSYTRAVLVFVLAFER